MTHDVFLSYKAEDRERAKIFAELLEQRGCSVWWDQKIPPGRTFHTFIEQKLSEAKCVVVLWSKLSALSDWVIEEAREGKRREILVPVLIDNVRPPFGFRGIQASRLIEWGGTLPNPEFDLLLQSVSRLVGRPLAVKTDRTGYKRLRQPSSTNPWTFVKARPKPTPIRDIFKILPKEPAKAKAKQIQGREIWATYPWVKRGENIDMVNSIVNYIIEIFKKDTKIDLAQDRQAMERVRGAAEKAKKELSSKRTTDINLPFISADSSGPKHLSITLSRAELAKNVGSGSR